MEINKEYYCRMLILNYENGRQIQDLLMDK